MSFKLGEREEEAVCQAEEVLVHTSARLPLPRSQTAKASLSLWVKVASLELAQAEVRAVQDSQ